MRTIIHNGKEYTFGNVEVNGVVREITDEEGVKFADLREADIIKDAEYNSQEWFRNRASEYPPAEDYLDGIVKVDQAQVDKYIADCQAVKDKYPKE